MLVSALCSKEEIMNVYENAKENEYRFFSFGDAMIIL
jgi:S-adenosylmethionine:tRNA ribosyltransferase-isomerase